MALLIELSIVLEVLHKVEREVCVKVQVMNWNYCLRI